MAENIPNVVSNIDPNKKPTKRVDKVEYLLELQKLDAQKDITKPPINLSFPLWKTPEPSIDIEVESTRSLRRQCNKIRLSKEDLKMITDNPMAKENKLYKEANKKLDSEIDKLMIQIRKNKAQILKLMKDEAAFDVLSNAPPPVVNTEVTAMWTKPERIMVELAVMDYGWNFTEIAQIIGTKTAADVKAAYDAAFEVFKLKKAANYENLKASEMEELMEIFLNFDSVYKKKQQETVKMEDNEPGCSYSQDNGASQTAIDLSMPSEQEIEKGTLSPAKMININQPFVEEYNIDSIGGSSAEEREGEVEELLEMLRHEFDTKGNGASNSAPNKEAF